MVCLGKWSVSLQACNFNKKETLARVFSCEFYKISKNTFSYRTPPMAAYDQYTPIYKLNSRIYGPISILPKNSRKYLAFWRFQVV